MIQKPPTTSFVSGNGPSVTFDLPLLKVTRALIVAGGVSPSTASSTPAFPSSSLYLPIFSMLLKSGTQPAFAVSYSFGNMIIMKRIFFSLSVERTPYQGGYFYIRAWTALARNVASGRVRGAALLTSRTGRPGIDTRFANFSRSVSPGKHFPAGQLPGLHHIVERPHRNSTSRRSFYFSCRIRSCRNCRSGSSGSAPELSHKTTEPQPFCRACGTYRHGPNVPGNNRPIRHPATLHRPDC